MNSLQKFQDPQTTLDGSQRASVPFEELETLWFNTGSQCNITCDNCYMESSPKNDRLVYINKEEVLSYVDEALRLSTQLKEVAFTGGEPFLNKDLLPIIEACLERKLKVMVLSNAMKPLARHREKIKKLAKNYGSRFVIRVSLDHHTEENHDKERGSGSFAITLEQLQNLSADAVNLHIAGRSLWAEDKNAAQQAYEKLFSENNIKIAEKGLIIFPEMDQKDTSPPEITTSCWDILNVKPSSMMCANSRMVIKRKGAKDPTVVACTLLPYDNFFDYGPDLKAALKTTYLKNVYCAQFCVLGGASCSGSG